jgi:hypothetical protein
VCQALPLLLLRLLVFCHTHLPRIKNTRNHDNALAKSQDVHSTIVGDWRWDLALGARASARAPSWRADTQPQTNLRPHCQRRVSRHESGPRNLEGCPRPCGLIMKKIGESRRHAGAATRAMGAGR